MTLQTLARRAETLVAANSPAILTAIGVTGTVTTALLSGKASFKAAEVIRSEEFRLNLHEVNVAQKKTTLDKKERIKLVWKLYIPATGTGVLTVVCIVGANRIGSRRAAAVAAAYSISEKAFNEYREKVVEKFGDNKEREVRDEVAQDRVRANPPTDREIFVTGVGDVLCYDKFSDRYFHTTMEDIKKAQNDVNYLMLHDGSASMNDFYNRVGLSSTTAFGNMGWNTNHPLELAYSAVLTEKNEPCMVIDFVTQPFPEFWRFV